MSGITLKKDSLENITGMNSKDLLLKNKLDLSSCKIKHLDSEILNCFPNVKELNLSGNLIRIFPTTTTTNSTDNTKNNKLNACAPAGENLELLDISDNCLASLEFLFLFPKLKEIICDRNGLDNSQKFVATFLCPDLVKFDRKPVDAIRNVVQDFCSRVNDSIKKIWKEKLSENEEINSSLSNPEGQRKTGKLLYNLSFQSRPNATGIPNSTKEYMLKELCKRFLSEITSTSVQSFKSPVKRLRIRLDENQRGVVEDIQSPLKKSLYDLRLVSSSPNKISNSSSSHHQSPLKKSLYNLRLVGSSPNKISNSSPNHHQSDNIQSQLKKSLYDLRLVGSSPNKISNSSSSSHHQSEKNIQSSLKKPLYDLQLVGSSPNKISNSSSNHHQSSNPRSPMRNPKSPAKNSRSPEKNSKSPAKNPKSPSCNLRSPARKPKSPAKDLISPVVRSPRLIKLFSKTVTLSSYDDDEENLEKVVNRTNAMNGGKEPLITDFEPVNFVRCHFGDKMALKEGHGEDDPTDELTNVWWCALEPSPHDRNLTTGTVATCGGNCVCLLDCCSGKVMKRYKQNKEQFYCLAWTTLKIDSEEARSAGSSSRPFNILAVGGLNAHLKLLNPSQLICYAEHGTGRPNRSVVDFYYSSLVFHPTKPTWLFCSSSDTTITLFDIGTPSGPNYSTSIVQLTVFLTQPNSCVFNLLIPKVNDRKNEQILLAGTKNGCYFWNLDNLNDRSSKKRIANGSINLPATNNCIDGLIQIDQNHFACKVVSLGLIYIFNLKKAVEHNDLPILYLDWLQTDTDYISITCKNGILACGSDDGSVWLYDMPNILIRSRFAFYKPGDKPFPPTLVLDWPVLKLGCRREDQQMVDVLDKPAPLVINCLALNHTGEYLVAVTDCNLVCIWKKCKEEGRNMEKFQMPTKLKNIRSPSPMNVD